MQTAAPFGQLRSSPKVMPQWRIASSNHQSGRFVENVLVLAVADDEHSLPGALSHHKLESVNGGVNGDEGDGAVVILARCHCAFPFAEVEDCGPALPQHR